MQLFSIGKFAKMIGVNPATLRRMQTTGELLPAHISKGGTRYYSEDQLKRFSQGEREREKLVIGYCRVSTPGQKDDLERQVQNVRSYMCAKGYRFEIISDVGSGINYRKQGLQTLLQMINERKISKIVVLYKDRLVRFGYEIIEHICFLNGVEIEVIDNTAQSREQELADDLIQIVTVFANRLYGQRSRKTKHLIEGVKHSVRKQAVAAGQDDPPEACSGPGGAVLEERRDSTVGL